MQDLTLSIPVPWSDLLGGELSHDGKSCSADRDAYAGPPDDDTRDFRQPWNIQVEHNRTNEAKDEAGTKRTRNGLTPRDGLEHDTVQDTNQECADGGYD